MGSDRSPRRGDFVYVDVCVSVILFKIAVKMSSSSILKSPAGFQSKQAGRQASRQAGRQESRQASKQISKQASNQASKQGKKASK